MSTRVPRFDYDASGISRVYDRARDHGPEVLDLWMRAVESATRAAGQIRTIVDLGCGTGRFTGALAAYFNADVIGIDPSARMLDQARAKTRDSRIRLMLARAENIPLPDGSVDLVFMSMVFHHFVDASRAAAECRRVLRQGGVAFLRAGTTDRIPRYPYVPFFPASVPLLYEVLQPCSHIRDTFGAAGFDTSSEDVLVQEIAATHAAYAEKLAAGADSVLARLSAIEMTEGLARLEAYADIVDPLPVSEPIDFFVFS